LKATEIGDEKTKAIPEVDHNLVLSESQMSKVFAGTSKSMFHTVHEIFPETAKYLWNPKGVPNGNIEYRKWNQNKITLSKVKLNVTRPVAERHVGAYVKFWREQFEEFEDKAPQHVLMP
jgi:hypothetical protein